MSEQTGVNKEHQLTKNASPENSQERQYSREDLINLSKLPESVRRPSCLQHVYDSENGKWDPERWYAANFEPAHESSTFALANGKDSRKVTDRDYKKRYSPNNPVERLKDERDGIVLSPQRCSFVTGCHVKTLPHSYTRHLSLPDREDSKGDWDQKRDQEKDSRERPVRKVDGGRVHFEERSLHDSTDSHGYGRDVEYDREFVRSRDKERERDRERKRDRDLRSEPARDKRGDRVDCFRSIDDKGYSARDWRDRDFRDRGFDRNSRRRNNRDEKEPEWYTGGPTSQADVIELRGFDHDEDHGHQMVDGRKPHPRKDSKSSMTFSGQTADRSRKGLPDASSPVSKVSQSSLEEHRTVQNEQKEQKNIPNQKPELHIPMTTQQNLRGTTNNKLFDFEEVLSAILPVDENGVRHGSRFSRFFPGPNGSMLESEPSSLEDARLSCDGNLSNSIVPSPSPTVGPMGALQHAYLCMPHFHGQPEQQVKPHAFPKPHHLVSVPDSAGDNNGHSPMLPSLTALFNSAARGGQNARRWDGSLETPDTSLFTNSAASSNSFNTQDAEAQLKAMLFGGNRESTLSSGTVSPARLPLGVHQKATTLAELEADMHLNSPHITSSLPPLPGGASSAADTGDITAFSKLLIMINAASEANQNMPQTQWSSCAGSGMVPSHNEFNLAVMRNKEKQIQLLQQSLHNTQQPVQPVPGMSSLPQQAFHSHVAHNGQSVPPQSQQQAPAMVIQQYQKRPLDGVTTPNPFADPGGQQSCSLGMPQAMSTPQPNYRMRPQAGGVSVPSHAGGVSVPSHAGGVSVPSHAGGVSVASADPILSLIQQNPRLIMNTVSPTPHVASMLASQQPLGSGPVHVSSPLMFGRMSPSLLGTLSPVQPCRSSPVGSFTFGANLPRSAVSSPIDMRLPVVSQALSPQELSAHNQAVITRQLLEQGDHYRMQEHDRAVSPGQHHIIVVRPVPAAQPVIPPTPQPKGASLDTFTPTSVLRKMHSDKVSETARTLVDAKKEPIVEFMPFMHDIAERDPAVQTDALPRDDLPQKSDLKLTGDLNGINFLDPVNPSLTAINGQLDSQVGSGQRGVVPGPLSQSMSVEEKMKLAEKPGYLSQILDTSAKVAAAAAENEREASLCKPGTRAEVPTQEDTIQQQNVPPTPHPEQTVDSQSCRAVTGAGPEVQGLSDSSATLCAAQQNTPAHKLATGRAIVGRSCAQHQMPAPTGPPAQNVGMMHVLEQQNQFQQMQTMAQCQAMMLHPPPVRTLVPCLDPASVAVPVSYQIPMPRQSPVAGSGVMQHQFVGGNIISSQQNPHISHMMAMQYSQQHCMTQPPPQMMTSAVSAQLNPYSQTSGPLSADALRAAIQRLASPPGAVKMNGPLQPTAAMHTGGGGGGGHRVDLTTGIQRWFNSDILRTQLPSLPPLPSHGLQVMTVDELERS